MKTAHDVTPPSGKLGVLIVGLNGAVSTTFIGGTLAIRRKLATPVGSLTQLGTIRLGRREENRFPAIKEFVPLARLDDIVFGGWDIPGIAWDQQGGVVQMLATGAFHPCVIRKYGKLSK